MQAKPLAHTLRICESDHLSRPCAASANIEGITTGPDGNLWFTDACGLDFPGCGDARAKVADLVA